MGDRESLYGRFGAPSRARNWIQRWPITGVIDWLPKALCLHLTVGLGFAALSLFLLWPITGGDYPPGVDTPTFLHLSWVTKLAVSGQLANPLVDPYWYGGFSYTVYPPLAYGLVGAISSLTSASLVDVYNAVLILAYGGLGFAAWFMAREFNLQWWSAVFVGLITLLAYPALSSVFQWGWFTSIAALPFALVSFALLERGLSRHSWRPALVAGVLMATATLIHHMTALALGLGLIPWFAYHLWVGRYSRRDLALYSLLGGLTTLAIIAPWAIHFLLQVTAAGFQREIPGLWLPQLSQYRANILDPSLVGVFIHPPYLGFALTALSLVGVLVALAEARRLAGAALILLCLVWFSMGAKANPLINLYPFSSLDVARFPLYMVPFMALLGAVALERFLILARQSWPKLLSPRIWPSVVMVTLAVLLVFPAHIAWQARQQAEPYRVQPEVRQALDWLATTPMDHRGNRPGVFAVGLWHWDAYLVPALAGRPLIDGWHDEGAANVGMIRQLRSMAWIGGDSVDAPAAHQILTTLGARYVLLHQSYWFGERTEEFWVRFEQRPDLFLLRRRWGDVGVFEVIEPRVLPPT